MHDCSRGEPDDVLDELSVTSIGTGDLSDPMVLIARRCLPQFHQPRRRMDSEKPHANDAISLKQFVVPLRLKCGRFSKVDGDGEYLNLDGSLHLDGPNRRTLHERHVTN